MNTTDGTQRPRDSVLPTKVLLSRLEELVRFISRYQKYFAADQYKGVANCIQSGFALVEKTYGDWCTRNNFFYIQQTMAEVFALFGNLPMVNAPACQVFGLFDNKAPPVLALRLVTILTLLGLRGIGPESHGVIIPPLAQTWIRELHQDGVPNVQNVLFSYKGGYGSYFRRVVKQTRMEYLTNTKVSQIKSFGSHVDGGVEITIATGSKLLFDKVIVATRPEQALSFLNPAHPMTSLYQAVSDNFDVWVKRVGVYASALVEVTVRPGTILSLFPDLDQYVMGLIDTLPPLAASDRLVSNSTITPLQITKLFDSSPIVSVLYQVSEEMVDTTGEQDELVGLLSRLGYENMNIVRRRHYPNTPSLLSIADVVGGWYEQANVAQGIDNMYFVGEVFAGHGVPTTWLHAEDFVEKMFGLNPKEVQRAKNDKICYPIRSHGK